LRKLALLMCAVLLAGLGFFVPAATPAASAATTDPKVVIIVGATHGATSTYRSYADSVAAQAAKYTKNVVKVYSPNATWSAVKSAVAGASVVVYLGHGNGWPSPYTYDPAYTTKNGFGLNSAAGQGDSNTKYYGEPSIETLAFAPNAVVLLFHLCYASGNSEPGHAEPTVSVARQRVDNYGAAFLRAGARAVIADGHYHDYYMSALFTTRQTIDQLWRSSPSFKGNVVAYPSSRTAGYTYQMDPKTATSGFYRSIVGRMDLRTEDVTGASYAATNVDPATFVVPGAASVAVDGAPLFPDSDAAAAATAGDVGATSVPANVKLRVNGQAGTGEDGSPLLLVTSFDGTYTGWMLGSSLVPRDSAAPRVWTVDDGGGAFSPNGDGKSDTYALSLKLSESASWTLRLRNGTSTIASTSGTGSVAAIGWDGKVGGAVAPDGQYTWSIEATDAWRNGPASTSGKVTLDTQAPSVSITSPTADVVPMFSPNGDGVRDRLTIGTTASEAGTLHARIRNAGGTVVANLAISTGAGATDLDWFGLSDAGPIVPDGAYEIEVWGRDRAGNSSPSESRTVSVYSALKSPTSSVAIFFPQDGDKYAAKVTFSFVLLKPATVSWTVRSSSGAAVRTIATEEAFAAGTHTFVWDGRDDAGMFVPRGTYRSSIKATNGSEGATMTSSVLADAFRIAVSDSTPARGQKITVTITSAENLAANPKLTVYQPGITAWTVSTYKVSTRVYRVTITLKSSSKGTLTLRARGTDLGAQVQRTLRMLPLS
jgi:flagellar hook assembly protein FlgD